MSNYSSAKYHKLEHINKTIPEENEAPNHYTFTFVEGCSTKRKLLNEL